MTVPAGGADVPAGDVTAPAGGAVDPFALPPATAGRFGLLLVATITGSCYLYSSVVDHVLDDAGAHCAGRARAVADRVLPDALVEFYTACSDWASLRTAAGVAVLLVMLLLVVLACYLAVPRRGRGSLMPLAAYGTTHPDAVAAVRRVVGPGTTVWVGDAPRETRAAGRLGRYSIVIGQADLADPGLPALLAHEVSHLENRDVDLTALAAITWWCFVIGVAAPAAFVAASTGRLVALGWRILLFVGIVYVLRLAVHHTREHYADLRAVRDGTSATGYLTLLASRGGSGSRWTHRFHPRRGKRERILSDARELFGPDLTTAASAGLLIGLAYRPAYDVIGLAWPSSVFGRDLLCGILVGGCAAAILAGGIWRSSLWAVRTGERRPRRLVSVAFTAGVLAGDFAAPAAPGRRVATAAAAPAVALCVAALLAVGCHLLLTWTAAAASSRLAVGGDARRQYHLGLLQAIVVAGVWLGFWFRLSEVIAVDASWRALAFGAASSAVLPVPLIAVWWAGVYATSAATRRCGAEVAGRFVAPLGPAYLAAGGALAAYTVVLWVDSAAIGAAIAGATGVEGLGHLALLLYTPAVVIPAPAFLVAGASVRGRGRTGLLVFSVVGVLPALAAGIMLVSLSRVVALDRTDRSLLTIVTGLGLLPGADAVDRPRYAALGLMILAIFAGLLVTSVPAAALGGLARRVLRPGDDRPVPARSYRRMAMLLSPVVTIAVLVAALGLREWSVVVNTVDLRNDYDTTGVQRAADGVRPGSLSRTEVCTRLYGSAGAFPYSRRADAGAAGHLAALAALGVASDDPVMQQLGRGALASLRVRELRSGAAGVTHLVRYCAEP